MKIYKREYKLINDVAVWSNDIWKDSSLIPARNYFEFWICFNQSWLNAYFKPDVDIYTTFMLYEVHFWA